MENALPTTQSTSTMLAPEEMFAPASKSDLVARSELDPLQKKRMRQKDRKTRMRQRQALDSAVDKFAGKSGGGGKARGGVKSQKDRALKELVKTGKGVSGGCGSLLPASMSLMAFTFRLPLSERTRSRSHGEAIERTSLRVRLSSCNIRQSPGTLPLLDNHDLYFWIRVYVFSICSSTTRPVASNIQISIKGSRSSQRSKPSRQCPQSSLASRTFQELGILDDGQIEIARLAVDSG